MDAGYADASMKVAYYYEKGIGIKKYLTKAANCIGSWQIEVKLKRNTDW